MNVIRQQSLLKVCRYRYRTMTSIAGSGIPAPPVSHAVKFHNNSDLFTEPETLDKRDCGKTVLLILNNAAGLSDQLISKLWGRASRRVCADGGSNWLHDTFSGKLIPDLVHGDLDSIRPEVAKYFESKGSKVEADKSDDTTDMDKCLSRIQAWPDSSTFTVIIAGIFGSRFDHEMGNLNSSYRNLDNFSRLLLISAQTIGEILEGKVTHRITPDLEREGPICGLIPLFGPCSRVDTSGLRWNLEGRGSAFGGLVSTSNEIAAKEIEILADAPLLWTTTFCVSRKGSNH